MSEIKKNDVLFDMTEASEFDPPKADDSTASEISELSKKGYNLLKDNKTNEAVASFRQSQKKGSGFLRCFCPVCLVRFFESIFLQEQKI